MEMRPLVEVWATQFERLAQTPLTSTRGHISTRRPPEREQKFEIESGRGNHKERHLGRSGAGASWEHTAVV